MTGLKKISKRRHEKIQTKEIGNMTYQNFCDAAKAVIREFYTIFIEFYTKKSQTA